MLDFCEYLWLQILALVNVRNFKIWNFIVIEYVLQ